MSGNLDMPLPVIKFTVTKPRILKRKTWTKILKRSWWEVGRFWHRMRKNRRFKRIQQDENDQFARNKGYVVKKGAVKKHQRPRDWSGTTRKAMDSIRDLRSTSQGVRIHLRSVPFYVKSDPRLATEMGMISENDKGVLVKFMDSSLTRNIRKEQRSGAFSER